jgi:hypothetical protein
MAHGVPPVALSNLGFGKVDRGLVNARAAVDWAQGWAQDESLNYHFL